MTTTSVAKPSADFPLQLNFAEVALSTESFTTYRTTFVSKEHLANLRKQFGSTHVVGRSGKYIFVTPLEDGPTFPGDRITVHVAEQPWLVTNLIRASVMRFIKNGQYKLLRDRPPTFMFRKINLVEKAAGAAFAGNALIRGLAMYPTYSLDPRAILRRHESPIFGIQANCRLSVEISLTVADLLALKVDVLDHYVVGKSAARPLRDFEIDRDERSTRRLLGRVVRIEGENLFLDDALGDEVVNAREVLLESRFENLIHCLDYIKTPAVARLKTEISENQFRYSGAEGRYNHITALVGRIRKYGALHLSQHLQANVGDLLRPRGGPNSGESRDALPPQFVFDIAQTKVADLPRIGLNRHGPFGVETFPARRADVIVIVPDAWRDATEVFLGKFKDGLPNEQTWSKGFTRKYHLADLRFHIQSFRAGPDEVTGYRDACIDAIKRLSEKPPSLAIVVVESRHRFLLGDSNPYLVSKSVLMSQGIPVQEVNIETVRQDDRALAWTFDNFGLASYAKMGGTPFVIATAKSPAHEMIIGLGSSVIKRRRIGQSERVVGITTVFSADGNYLFSNATREVDYADYPAALLDTLRVLLNAVRRRNAWQKGDDVRLIFHVFKPLRDLEAKAVKQSVNGLTANYRVEYAFLHVSNDHDWFLFDTSVTGATNSNKGKWVPRRGVVVPFGPYEALLTVKSQSEMKTPKQGIPKPLLLHLHRESTFTDLDYLADQVFKFTGISWRQFLANSTPATIAYSEQIAKLLGRLRQVRNWNPDILGTQLGRARKSV